MNSRQEKLLETMLEPVFIASGYMATDDRPLAEMTAARHLKEGVDFELRRCPYSGSRFGKDMNVSALPGLSQQIKNVISDTLHIRDAYLTHIGETDFTLESFWFFTRVLDSLPVYLVRKKESACDKSRIPARVSALFKAAQGLHLVPEVMLLAGNNPNEPVDTDEVMEYIEEQGLYLDGSRACAGPLSMIKAFVRAALEGIGKRDCPSDLYQALGSNSFNGLIKYSDAVTKVFASKICHEAESRLRILEALEIFNSDSLQKEASSALDRFGSLRQSDSQKLDLVAKHTAGMLKQSSPNLRVTLINSDRFRTMLTLRNPRFDKELCQQAIDLLIQFSERECQWLDIFSIHQRDVLKALGYIEEMPSFTGKDFSGLGYSALEIFSRWLSVELDYSTESLVVMAGASGEVFQWKCSDK